jgi:diguanylate cyclase (GGDEF)-like protein
MDSSEADTLEFIAPVAAAEPKSRSFCLIVMEGPNKGATFKLSTGLHTLGRAEECAITLEGRGLSRTHASVTVKPHGDVIVEDLGSTNGVYLEGERVSGPRQIEPGQTIGLGPEVRLRLELSAGSVQNLLQEMYECATLDSLTGLLTRRGFEERLEVEFAMVSRHRMSSCLAVIDLDRFKGVNDREGHDAGDAVLQALAAHLKANVRTGDLACRWGGEEFIVYIRQTPLIGGVTLVERLREQLADTDIALPKGNSIRVTFSAGIVDLLEFQDWREAFRKADEALYRAKREGRNRVVPYSPADG